jgi:hypothetical protein
MKGSALKRIVGGAATGSASTALLNPDDAIEGGAYGAALPGVLMGAGKLGKLAGRQFDISPEVKKLAAKAEELGVDIPADRLINSMPINAIASGLNYLPFSGRAATEDKMAQQMTRAASRLMGQDTHNMTKAVRDAGVELGAKFDDTLKNNTITVGDKLLDNLSEIETAVKRDFGGKIPETIKGQIDEILRQGENGAIDGQAGYVIKRRLDRLGKGGSPEAYHMRQIKEALLEALNDSLGADKAKAFGELRKQYSNMLTLQKLAKNGAEGDISIARLANIKNIKNKDLRDVADVAAQFVRPREAQHGSMQRAVAGLTTAGLAGAPGFAALAAGGRGVNEALKSKALRNMILQNRGPNNKLMEIMQRGAARSLPAIIATDNRENLNN